MIKIVFVCLGNICRSPMAEFYMRDLIEKKGLSSKFKIISRATSMEEYGNPVHRGTRQKLAEHGISCVGKRAELLTVDELDEFDYVIIMDRNNRSAVERLARSGGCALEKKVKEEKLFSLTYFSGKGGDIADPWWTGNFEDTWQDVSSGCDGLLNYLVRENKC